MLFRLADAGVDPLPGRSLVYRCLVRHGLIEPEARRRRKADYKRWERARPMELWQMDVVGGVMLADGWKASIVSGIDVHSRFIISAHMVRRATARPVCDGLAKALRAFGVPAQVLTDNGKVFTGRFGPGTGEVLFDRICRENGIKHILTAPRSPTTTGKVERWHKTLRREFLNGKVFESVEDAQAQVDDGFGHTTSIAGIKGSVMLFRGNGSVWLARIMRLSRSRLVGLGRCQQLARLTGRAKSVSLRWHTRSGCGLTVRLLRWRSRRVLCRSLIVVCLWRLMRRGIAPTRSRRRFGVRPKSPNRGLVSPLWASR